MHVWRMERNRLPTRLNLRDKGIALDSVLCPVCSGVGESSDHLIASCPIVLPLWAKVASWWNVPPPPAPSIGSLLKWSTDSSLSKTHKVRFEAVVFVVCWVIWSFRNKLLFGSVNPRKDELFDDIRYYSFLWISNRDRNSNFSWVDWLCNPYLV